MAVNKQYPTMGDSYDGYSMRRLVEIIRLKDGQAPAAPASTGWTVTSTGTSRTLVAATASTEQVAEFVCTLINDLIAAGYLAK